MNLLAIVGAGGFGREVMPIARKVRPVGCEVVFVVERESPMPDVNGHRVMLMDQFVALNGVVKGFNIAIGDSMTRLRIAERLSNVGVTPIAMVDPTVWQGDANEIGEGAILCPFVTITSNARIGRFFHANLYSYVAHDCVIGDFVTFAPGVKCNGNVSIEDHAYIGAGAILKQGIPGKPLRIGARAVIGMGAVVTRDVPPGTTVIGNPARVMVR